MSTVTPISFSVLDARSRLIGSKDEYLAFTAAWKALTCNGKSLPSGCYAAHAILMGRDLYKTFSASKRPHDAGQPYHALLQALAYLSNFNRNSKSFEVKIGRLTPEQAEALRRNIQIAARAVASLHLTREAIVNGSGNFKGWAMTASLTAAPGAYPAEVR